MNRRRLTPWLLLALACAGAGGCGKGEYRPSAPRASVTQAQSAAAALAADSAIAPRTPAGKRSFARTVNLTAADIPGATAAAEGHRPQLAESEPSNCGGAISDRGAVQASSPDFARGSALTRESISSRVTILSSARLARQSVDAVGQPSWLRCYERFLRGHFAGVSTGGVRVGRISVSTLPVHLAGVSQTFGLRIRSELTSSSTGLSINVYLDALGFALGAAEMSMDATSYVQPEATRTEHDLLVLMMRRAIAQAR